MKTEELIIKVTQWAKDRNIIDGCPPIKQAYKTLEECGELIEAVALHKWADNHLSEEECQDSKEPIKDAIGDITVTLIIQCAMQGIDFVDCLAGAYDTIKDRRGNINWRKIR